MCGICGIYRFHDEDDDRHVVDAMLDRLVARGPDDSGIYEESGHPATLGNRRLAIQDLSHAGHQPMSSPDGRYTITFNGEIYNPDDLRRSSGLSRDRLSSNGDTEILLRSWERFGPKLLPQMVGQWAFAIYDREERTLWLARDRFGEKPLYYHLDQRQLSFASSIEALLVAPSVSRRIDHDALIEYVAMRYVVSPRTILAGIRKLPPGHLMRVTPEGTDIRKWYGLPAWDGARRDENDDDVINQFDELFRQAVQRCRIGDVPVATFLSDGIDSNSIQAAQVGLAEELPCFTFVAEEDRGTTRDAGADSAWGQPVVISMEDRIRDMEPALRSLTEPVGDGVAIATWQLVNRCRPHATIFLCGHGGDEIMGGYRMDQDMFRLRLLHLASRLGLPLPASVADRYLNGPGSRRHRQARLRRSSRSEAPAAARYLIHRPLATVDLRAIFGPDADLDTRWETVDRLYDECPRGACDLDRMQHVMLNTFLTENLLSFSDAAGMASSAELRLPFLDRDLVDFVLRLPPGYRVRPRPGRQNNKVLLRKWAKGRMHEDIIHRRKAGFSSGSIAAMLETPSARVRERLLDEAELTAAMPGLENWLRQPGESFTRSREGSMWALLSLAVWYDGLKGR